MATKYYPPYIEGVLPAFATEYSSGSERTQMKIDFEHNPSVTLNEISGVRAVIRAIQDNSLIATIDVAKENFINEASLSCIFDLSEYVYKLIIGNYYTVQIAYYSNDSDNNKNIGYYSTLGVIKYTTYPNVEIDISNNSSLIIKTVVKQDKKDSTDDKIYDVTEKLYSLKYTVRSTTGKEIVKTIIHNTEKDVNYDQIDEYDFGAVIKAGNVSCSVEYCTKNGLVGIVEKTTSMNLTSTSVGIDVNQDKNLGILTLDKSHQYKVLLNNDDFSLFDIGANSKYYYECGQTVQFAYINTAKNELCLSEKVKYWFEDLILSDAQGNCLNIQYNPTISSFKNVVLETKTDTIGSQYPFIYRNDDVKYKEMQIGGLISYHLPNDGINFNVGIVNNISSRDKTPSALSDFQESGTNLSDENIKRELDFKLKVMDWLNDGMPKLLRSPTEGTYLVRLVNVSLTPEKILGRMLHAFTATAYEIDGHDIPTLKKYGFYGG